MTMSLLRAAWGALRREADWRAFTGGDPPWNTYDAVIVGGSSGPGGTRAPRQSYEVYEYGKLIAQRHKLSEAEQVIEARHGEQRWSQGRTDPVEVEHYHFGPTTEFSSPNTYWFVEKL